MKRNIVICHEGTPDGPIPKTLREVGVTRILNRPIIGWSQSLGSYGMGGPGFWGFLLGKQGAYPEEWLILTLWHSGVWLRLDGHKTETIPQFVPDSEAKLLEFHRQIDGRIEELRGLLVGAIIEDAEVADTFSKFHLRVGESHHILDIPREPPDQWRAWNPEESHWDAWVVSQHNRIWV